jgi:hypothetical protein
MVSVLSGIAACGEDDHAPVATNFSRGGNGTGARGGTSGNEGGEGGSGGEMEPTNPLAPVVSVTNPEGLSDPDDGEVLTAGTVTVTCDITQSTEAGAQPVDPTTVKVQLLDGEGNVVAEVDGVPGEDEGTFSGTLTVPADLPNGEVRLQCVASDTSAMPIQGLGFIDTFVDQGPTIIASEPIMNSAHALEGAVAFEFDVLPAPLADGDEGAEISEVTLDVNGISIDVDQDGDTYTTDIDFTDPVLFPDTPTGIVPVLIRATNSREPEPITRTLGYDIVIDGEGPAIEITSHASNDVVGGQVVLEFTVTDALTAVNRDSVSIQLNNEDPVEFVDADPWTEANGVYTYSFDSRNIVSSKVQITVNISATDTVGNDSSGASLTLWIDNTPPAVDLDPSNVREFKLVGGVEHCSSAFDPVGPEAVNDEGLIGEIETFRVAVWEQTNGILGQNVFHYAGTDTESVYIYLQPDVDTPLLIDTDDDADNLCDELAVEDVGVFLQLEGIGATGAAIYDDYDSGADPDQGTCVLDSTSAVPDPLCESDASDMHRVIAHDGKPGIPVIFAKPELVGAECTGAQWEIGPFIDQDGWVCLAARAVDVVGNVGISPPLRACFDSLDIPGEPACATMSDTPPDCTDTCTPPPGWGSVIIKN